MERLMSAAAAKETDRRSIQEVGIPSLVLMERAACACAERVREALAGKARASVLVLAACGNNGADGLAVARMLCEQMETAVLTVGDEARATDEWKTQRQILSHLPVHFLTVSDDWQAAVCRADAVVDAFFGIGLTRAVEGVYAEVLSFVNDHAAGFRLAVDMPSGIHTDTGAVCGQAFRADETVTFGYRKPGHLLYPGRAYAGQVTCRDIGFPQAAAADTKTFVCTPTDIRLPLRDPAGNKRTFGHAALFAGSRGMAGASVFAAKAALSTGTGLVRVLAPEANREILQIAVPEAVLSVYENEPDGSQVESLLSWADAVACGPGIGTGETAGKTLEAVLRARPQRLVLDADALNLLAGHPEWRALLTPETVLTPHPGELSRLMGEPVSELLKDPVGSARRAAEQFGCIVAAKNACTVTALPDGRVFLNETGSDALAKGGSGDVLTGLIAGLLAAGVQPEQAAVWGVCLHGEAGAQAGRLKGPRACSPMDVIGELGNLLKERGTENAGQ